MSNKNLEVSNKCKILMKVSLEINKHNLWINPKPEKLVHVLKMQNECIWGFSFSYFS